MQGVIKWFSAEKGYGFITADGTDYPVKVDDLQEPHLISNGVHVQFDPTLGQRSLRARNVYVLRG